MANTNTQLWQSEKLQSAAYDEIVYTSFPFPQTSPLLMQSNARLFGFIAPSPHKARILEIGCASGGNIMSIASCYPESHCVGIDYSARQIALGLSDIKAAGISNLELLHMSVMDITKEFGQFDYIIAHGIFSWVPPEVQEKILNVCNVNLAPDGIAYVSYNTLPGWNNLKSLRDVMMYHAAGFQRPAERIQQARWVLKFMNESTKGDSSLIATAVEREIQNLEGQPDYYLFHEYLEEHNQPLYFHEFMLRAKNHQLQYLGDVSIETMFSGNLPEDTSRILATSNDIVRTEQFMDFINDRRFRQTLLCHDILDLSWTVPHSVLQEGWFVSKFSFPEGFAQHNIISGQKLNFTGALNLMLSVEDPMILAMLQVFHGLKKQAIRSGQLTAMAAEKLQKLNFRLTPEQVAALEEKLLNTIVRYIFMGGVAFYIDQFPHATSVSAKPKASKLVRYQASVGEYVSNQRQESISVSYFQRLLLQLLDGTRDLAALIHAMTQNFEDKKVMMNDTNGQPLELEEVKRRLPKMVPDTLSALCEYALLVA